MLMGEKEDNIKKNRDYSQLDNKTFRWYVMLHPNPQLLDLQLQRENVRRSLLRQDDLPLLEYFIPFCFLSRLSEKENRKEADRVEEANNLREDFHDFAFLHATQRQIVLLMDSEWNHAMRGRLRHYRDRQWREVIITEEEKNNLIAVFSELRIRFSIGLPVPDLGPDVKVKVRKEGSFRGQTARIIEVKHTSDGIFLKLGIPMFNGMKELKLSDLTLEDIQAENVPDDIIGTLFVQDKERLLTDIFERRVKHTETDETCQQDAVTLNHTFLYSYVAINDAFLSARFQALMLICATLRFDRESVKALVRNVREHLNSGIAFPPDTEAWLNISLYIATRDADYRTAGKQCVRQHPECASESLRRLVSLACNLHSKRKRAKDVNGS